MIVDDDSVGSQWSGKDVRGIVEVGLFSAVQWSRSA